MSIQITHESVLRMDTYSIQTKIRIMRMSAGILGALSVRQKYYMQVDPYFIGVMARRNNSKWIMAYKLYWTMMYNLQRFLSEDMINELRMECLRLYNREHDRYVDDINDYVF
jgi:hypothetical protein